VSCYFAFEPDGILGAASAEPEPAWPRAVALALVHAVPYLFRCRAVMLSCGWIFGRVGWAWLVPVCSLFMVLRLGHRSATFPHADVLSIPPDQHTASLQPQRYELTQ
jgi:hypothetical protein